MAKRIKRFFVFLFFSLFFSLLSGRVTTETSQKGSKVSPLSNRGLNSALAGQCCLNGICKDGDRNYCCEKA